MSLHVLFKVGDAEYVVPAAAVLQMDSFRGATPVPGAPPYVSGLVQVRGRVIPIVDLRARFGLAPIERTLDARIIVVSAGVRQVGLLADSAREVLMIDDDKFEAPPEVIVEQSRGFVSAIAQTSDKRIVMRLRFESVITPEVLATPVVSNVKQEQPHGSKA
jgi:purine-binding chemotaxis protein CheW